MRYLIDGFNLFHVAMRRRDDPDTPPGELEVDQFLRTLASLLGHEQAARTTIVFDARRRPLWTPRTEERYGMHVINAVDAPEADVVIMRMIDRDSGPRDLLVVSSDAEIRQAAKRRKARYCSSEKFVEQLHELAWQRARESPDDEEKPQGPLSPEQVDYYMKLFMTAFEQVDSGTAASPRRRPKVLGSRGTRPSRTKRASPKRRG